MQLSNLKNLFNKIGKYFIPILGGLLGAFGGAEGGNKAFRRFLIPTLITSYAFSMTESILTLTIMFMAIPLSKGYGIPDETDNGSSLGRFFYNLFNKNKLLANIFTRGTIGLFIGITLLSIPIIKHNWLIYFLGILGIILINGSISWQNLGSYKLFGKQLIWSETLTWGLITLCAILIIIF